MLPKGITGLSDTEAKERLGKNGPNVLPEKKPPTALKIFLIQFKSPLVYVLLFAVIVSVVLNHYSDAVIIAIAVTINAVLGFFQEERAGKALSALRALLVQTVTVIRDSNQVEVNLEEIVVGDVIVANRGSKIPGDGKVLFSNRFYANEAIITGESFPVEKKVGDGVFMGCVVTSGRAYIKIEKTGKNTRMGQIAHDVGSVNEDTPLRRQLTKFSKQLVILVSALTFLVFVIGFFVGSDLEEMFKTSVALAVSAIPEGLLVSLTVVLAIGMQRILKKKGLVRNLASAETLGGVTTICVDKTGTLTTGEMKIDGIIGNKEEIATQMLVANDLDDPLTITSFDWARGVIKNNKSLIQNSHRIDSLSFSSAKRYFASLNIENGKKTLFVNGAPDRLIDRCELKKGEKEKIIAEIEEKTKQGKRLIGLARKTLTSSKQSLTDNDIVGLSWVGMLSFSDPVRKGVFEALKKAKTAGIKIKVITGDYSQTAINVMEQLGFNLTDKQITTGKQLPKLSSSQIYEKVLFARTTPDQKLRIVKTLKEKGEVIAMMGDGVNDAPALASSDIGIVVSSASDVAKESSDLVLMDSNFSTIISAVEEGRGMFDNIRKIILYLMADAFEEIIAVVLSLLVGVPLPVTAAQILWINLVSDGFPSLALSVDPKREHTMNEPPRDPSEPLVSGWIRKLILIVSVFGGAVGFLLFFVFLKTTGDIILARSVAFASLGINSLVYVFSVRTLKKPFWQEQIFKNPYLNIGVLAGLGLQIFPFTFHFTRNFFVVYPLQLIHWMIVFTAAILMFVLIELFKWQFSK